MAPARRVRGIKPAKSFQWNGARIIEARLTDMLGWRTAITDPARTEELHAMRIAAKRLRYALEIFSTCFPDLKPSLEGLTDIQESLGTIHDLDVLSGMLRDRLQALDLAVREQAIQAAREAGSTEGSDERVRVILEGSACDLQRIGLLALLGEKVVERENLYQAFIARWHGEGLDRLADAIRQPVA